MSPAKKLDLFGTFLADSPLKGSESLGSITGGSLFGLSGDNLPGFGLTGDGWSDAKLEQSVLDVLAHETGPVPAGKLMPNAEVRPTQLASVLADLEKSGLVKSFEQEKGTLFGLTSLGKSAASFEF